MKSQIRLGLCLALGLSLYACSSEGEPIGPKTPPVPEERPAFTLDLEAEGALSELRGDFELDFKVGSKGALKVNVKENQEYKARCFLRQEGQEKCYYGDVTFTGQKNGKLKVERGANSKVDFYDQSDDKTGGSADKKFGFTKGQTWYLLVVFGGERMNQSGLDKTRIRFSSENTSNGNKALTRVSEGQEIKLTDVPYISEWTKLEIREEGGDGGVAQALPLSFKPLGTLLRIRTKNNLSYASVQVRGLSFTLNNASSSVIFSLKGGKGNDKPTYARESGGNSVSVSLSAGAEIPAGGEDSGYYLLWLYPEQETGSTFTTTGWSIIDKATQATSAGATTASMPSRSQAKSLKRGTSNWVVATVDRPRMILDLLDEYNFVGAAPHRANNHSNQGHQMYTHASARAIANNQHGYHLPSQEEWQMIIGLANAGLPKATGISISAKDEALLGSLFFDVNQGTTKSDYYPGPLNAYHETNIFYGLRFRGHNMNHSTSTFFSAWRYEVIQNPKDPNGYIYCIRSRYLGPSSTLKIADIANETWWSTQDPNEVVRYLPFAGGYFAGVKDKATGDVLIPAAENINHPYQVGNWGTYWTSTTTPAPASARAAGETYYVLAGAKYYPDYREWFLPTSPNKKPDGYNDAIFAPAFTGNLNALPEGKHASVRLIKNY